MPKVYDLMISQLRSHRCRLKAAKDQELNLPIRQVDVVTTSWQRLFVRPNDLAGTSQVKHPTTSQWNVAKASQWYVPRTPLRNVVTTSQGYVTSTCHWYVSRTSQTSLK